MSEKIIITNEDLKDRSQNQASTQPVITTALPYSNYTDVPVYRRQWFFWLMYLIITPVGILILLTGDVYYTKRGVVKSFGVANRIVAGIIAAIWLYAII